MRAHSGVCVAERGQPRRVFHQGKVLSRATKQEGVEGLGDKGLEGMAQAWKSTRGT